MTSTKFCELVSNDSFVNILKNELYALIDEELSKNTEMDCELIDELVNAIEQLEQCEDENLAVVIPLIFGNGTHLSNRIRNKVNGTKLVYRITAVAAAVAIILSSMNSIPASKGKGESILEYAVNELIEEVEKVFGIISKEETPSNEETSSIEETTTVPIIEETTTEHILEETVIQEKPQENKTENKAEARKMTGIELVSGSGFKTEYFYRESLSLDGLSVFALYSDDTRESISTDDCEVVGYNSARLGEQIVTIKYEGFQAQFKVNVLKTKLDDTSSRVITDVDVNNQKTFYRPLGQEFSMYDIEWRYVFSDGTYSEYYSPENRLTLVNKDYDPNLEGVEQTLTYRVPNGMEFDIKVLHYDNTVSNGKTVTDIMLFDIPYYMYFYKSQLDDYSADNYFVLKDDPRLDFNEFIFRVKYEGSDRWWTVELKDSDIRAYGTLSNENTGKYNVIFTYGDAIMEFTYEVFGGERLTDFYFARGYWDTFHINEAPAVEDYYPEDFVFGTVNGVNATIDPIVEYKGYDPTKVGPIELDVYYNGEFIGSTVSGYIYDDESFFISRRPEYDITPDKFYPLGMFEFTYTPELTLKYCKTQGEFMTYGEEKSGNGLGDLDARGITLYEYTDPVGSLPTNHDDKVAIYKLSAPEELVGYGEHTVTYTIYNPQTNEPEEEFIITHTINQLVKGYRIEAPDNILININNIQAEFYDKIKVYEVYSGGTEKEIYNYVVTRYSPSSVTSSDVLKVEIAPQSSNKSKIVTLYAYADGYEDAWYLSLPTNEVQQYEIGDAPNFSVTVSSATGTIETVKINAIEGTNYKVEGFNSTIPEVHTGTVIYTHEVLGELVANFEYEIPYYIPSMTVTVPDDLYYDPRTGDFSHSNFEVLLSDGMGNTYLTDDYTVTKYNIQNARIKCTDPYTNKTLQTDVLIPMIPVNTTVKAYRATGPYGAITLEFVNDFEDGELQYTLSWAIDDYVKKSYQVFNKNVNILGYNHLSQAKEVTGILNIYILGADGKYYEVVQNQKFVAPIGEAPETTVEKIEMNTGVPLNMPVAIVKKSDEE